MSQFGQPRLSLSPTAVGIACLPTPIGHYSEPRKTFSTLLLVEQVPTKISIQLLQLAEICIVPVIAVFTKFDGLVDETFAKLLSNGCSYEEAEERALPQARETLSTDFEAPLARFEFHPSDCVQMHGTFNSVVEGGLIDSVTDMREAASDCSELIAKTANALNDDRLQMLLVSVQQNNMNLCVKYAVRV